MPNVKQETTGQPSTASYATLLKARLIGLTKCSLVITNSHGVNSIKYKILVSNHPNGAATSFAEDKTEATLAAGAKERYVVTGPFAWVDVQIIDGVSGHGEGNCWLEGVGL